MNVDLPVPWPDRIDTRRVRTSSRLASHCCCVGVAPRASWANRAGPPSRHLRIVARAASHSGEDAGKGSANVCVNGLDRLAVESVAQFL